MADPRQTAMQRALRRLAKEHPDRYTELFNEERASVGLPPVTPKAGMHGTRGRYVHGKCRCDLCVAANNEYQKRYMPLHRRGIRLTDSQ